MIVRLGDREFDDVLYDADGDVLYLSRGSLSRRMNGQITVSIPAAVAPPERLETSAEDLAPALVA